MRHKLLIYIDLTRVYQQDRIEANAHVVGLQIRLARFDSGPRLQHSQPSPAPPGLVVQGCDGFLSTSPPSWASRVRGLAEAPCLNGLYAVWCGTPRPHLAADGANGLAGRCLSLDIRR